jgi:hypothetical protein
MNHPPLIEARLSALAANGSPQSHGHSEPHYLSGYCATALS